MLLVHSETQRSLCVIERLNYSPYSPFVLFDLLVLFDRFILLEPSRLRFQLEASIQAAITDLLRDLNLPLLC